MKENDRNQAQELRLPPAWCSSLCRNAMNEKCIEDCALKRDCSGFELRAGINLIEMPRFPIDEIGSMTKEEKFTSVAVYVAKTVDHLKGVQDEPTNRPLRRPSHDSPASSGVPTYQQSQDILHASAATVTLFENRAERPSENERSTTVDQSKD
jgi:hypothetical protein